MSTEKVALLKKIDANFKDKSYYIYGFLLTSRHDYKDVLHASNIVVLATQGTPPKQGQSLPHFDVAAGTFSFLLSEIWNAGVLDSGRLHNNPNWTDPAKATDAQLIESNIRQFITLNRPKKGFLPWYQFGPFQIARGDTRAFTSVRWFDRKVKPTKEDPEPPAPAPEDFPYWSVKLSPAGRKVAESYASVSALDVAERYFQNKPKKEQKNLEAVAKAEHKSSSHGASRSTAGEKKHAQRTDVVATSKSGKHRHSSGTYKQ